MRLALTGGIAEGKSTVLGMLRSLGFETFSSDDAVRHILNDPQIGSAAMAAIGVGGAFDRAAVARAIAQDHEARRSLNRILHKQVMLEIQNSGAQIFEIPLLFEACVSSQFETVWAVTCGAEEQLARLQNRVRDTSLAKALIGSQLASRAKAAMSDEVVRTNRPLEAVFSHVQELVQKHWPRTG